MPGNPNKMNNAIFVHNWQVAPLDMYTATGDINNARII